MNTIMAFIGILILAAMAAAALSAVICLFSAIVIALWSIPKFLFELIASKPYHIHNFHGGWGDAIYWNRRGVESSGIYGFTNGWQISNGDVVLDAHFIDSRQPYHPKTLYKAYRVKHLKFERDPPDMFFADVEYIGATRLGEILRKDVNKYDLEKLHSWTDYCIRNHYRFGAREVVVYDDEKKTWRSE